VKNVNNVFASALYLKDPVDSTHSSADRISLGVKTPFSSKVVEEPLSR